ncbi:hypothetical protein CAOG_01141 [Capsaspora owczarzaki ATCC 30864]|uniref:CDT1 Geminin-binding domain-containing protein n=1 Tax=Capsaspora owczarzaki (strain ATCC 30864) TaxID=595528 RepID=A0A0D2WIM5_CAPO3|nr:hypothetical protein CAOG_01141 [Capsaspora owczarzaki ATCC 30864]KJE89710.1 hypothetical protein CAOG_001141 [Capsaspora owczarzaki ATCC 30864]|eukprot:XP_004366012.1 hypothetical protein CAOG_01141 [Capsaspora owczarzaki ATCC 30864]
MPPKRGGIAGYLRPTVQGSSSSSSPNSKDNPAAATASPTVRQTRRSSGLLGLSSHGDSSSTSNSNVVSSSDDGSASAAADDPADDAGIQKPTPFQPSRKRPLSEVDADPATPSLLLHKRPLVFHPAALEPITTTTTTTTTEVRSLADALRQPPPAKAKGRSNSNSSILLRNAASTSSAITSASAAMLARSSQVQTTEVEHDSEDQTARAAEQPDLSKNETTSSASVQTALPSTSPTMQSATDKTPSHQSQLQESTVEAQNPPSSSSSSSSSSSAPPPLPAASVTNPSEWRSMKDFPLFNISRPRSSLSLSMASFVPAQPQPPSPPSPTAPPAAATIATEPTAHAAARPPMPSSPRRPHSSPAKSPRSTEPVESIFAAVDPNSHSPSSARPYSILPPLPLDVPLGVSSGSVSPARQFVSALSSRGRAMALQAAGQPVSAARVLQLDPASSSSYSSSSSSFPSSSSLVSASTAVLGLPPRATAIPYAASSAFDPSPYPNLQSGSSTVLNTETSSLRAKTAVEDPYPQPIRLPAVYEKLERKFQALEDILRTRTIRDVSVSLQSLTRHMSQGDYKLSFGPEDLALIMALMPNAYSLKVLKSDAHKLHNWADSQYQLHVRFPAAPGVPSTEWAGEKSSIMSDTTKLQRMDAFHQNLRKLAWTTYDTKLRHLLGYSSDIKFAGTLHHAIPWDTLPLDIEPITLPTPDLGVVSSVAQLLDNPSLTASVRQKLQTLADHRASAAAEQQSSAAAPTMASAAAPEPLDKSLKNVDKDLLARIQQKQQKSLGLTLDKLSVAWQSAVQNLQHSLSNVQFSLEFGKRTVPVPTIMAQRAGGADVAYRHKILEFLVALRPDLCELKKALQSVQSHESPRRHEVEFFRLLKADALGELRTFVSDLPAAPTAEHERLMRAVGLLD